MIISHSRRFILFNNPFTGSDGLCRTLEELNEEPVVAFDQRIPERPFYHHMSPREAAWTFDAMGLPFHEYERITLIRNPFLRLPEVYTQIVNQDRLWRLRELSGLGRPSFETWLTRIRTDGRGGGGSSSQRWRRFGTWSVDAWCDGSISAVVDAQEATDRLPEIFGQLGVELPVSPQEKAIGRETGKVNWTESAVELVATSYGADCARYGYSPRHTSVSCKAA